MSQSASEDTISRPDNTNSSDTNSRRENATPSEGVSPVTSRSNTVKPHAIASDEKFLVLPEIDSTEIKPFSPADSDKQVSLPADPPNYSEKQPLEDAGTSHSDPKKDAAAPDALETEMGMQSGYDKEIVHQSSAAAKSVTSLSTLTPSSRSYFEYSFYSTSSFTNLIICDPHRLAIYYANMTMFTRGRADVTLHDVSTNPDVQKSGSSLKSKDGQSGKVAAVAEFVAPGKNIKLGFGDPENVENVRWLHMKNIPGDQKGKGEKYELTVPSSEQQQKRDFQWVMGGDGTSNSKDSFWVVSGSSILASYKSASLASWKKKGVLRLYDTPEMEELRLMICLSSAALCERQRRVTMKKSLLMK